MRALFGVGAWLGDEEHKARRRKGVYRLAVERKRVADRGNVRVFGDARERPSQDVLVLFIEELQGEPTVRDVLICARKTD